MYVCINLKKQLMVSAKINIPQLLIIYLMCKYVCSISVFNFLCSNGPQKCNACIKEDIFEDPTSILKQGCVSIKVLKEWNFSDSIDMSGGIGTMLVP